MNYRTYDVKTAKRSAEPHIISTFERSAKLQSRYFAAINGDTHLEERNNTIHRLVNLHEDHPAALSVDFAVDTWGRMVEDYNESSCEGDLRLLRMLPKGRRRDKIARIALSDNRDNSPAWHFPRIFNVDRPHGFWQGVIKPELERKVGQQLQANARIKRKPTHPAPEPTGGSERNNNPSLLENDYAKRNTNCQLPVIREAVPEWLCVGDTTLTTDVDSRKIHAIVHMVRLNSRVYAGMFNLS